MILGETAPWIQICRASCISKGHRTQPWGQPASHTICTESLTSHEPHMLLLNFCHRKFIWHAIKFSRPEWDIEENCPEMGLAEILREQPESIEGMLELIKVIWHFPLCLIWCWEIFSMTVYNAQTMGWILMSLERSSAVTFFNLSRSHLEPGDFSGKGSLWNVFI